jgi:hypothetical protein
MMTEGLGDETQIINNSSNLITKLVSAGTDTVQSSITHTCDNIENLMLLGSAAINGTEHTANNILKGNSSTAGFSSTTDAVIEITGFGRALTSLAVV